MMTIITTSAVTVTKLGSRIGARIDGLRLGGELDTATVNTVYQALLGHKVVFLRGQDHLDDAQQQAFAALLGTPVAVASLLQPSKRCTPVPGCGRPVFRRGRHRHLLIWGEGGTR